MTSTARMLSLLAGEFAICRFGADEQIPAWAGAGGQEFVSVTRTGLELSVICSARLVPDAVTAERGWHCLRLEGPFPADEAGVLAGTVAPLAEAGLSVFAVATYDTDYLLVRDLPLATAALAGAGHTVKIPHDHGSLPVPPGPENKS
jgi:hypothetical protein